MLALEEYHAHLPPRSQAIDLVVQDDRGQCAKAEALYRAAAADKPRPLVVFLHDYEATRRLGPAAARDGVILLNPIDNDASLARSGANTFAIAKQTERLASLLVRSFLRDQGSRALIAYNADHAFMEMLGRHIESLLSSLGIAFESCAYSAATGGPSACLGHNRTSATDGTILLGYYELRPAIIRLRRHFTGRLYLANPVDGLVSPCQALEGARFPMLMPMDGNDRDATEYLARFAARFRTAPKQPWVAFQAYDATRIALLAKDRVRGASASAAAFRLELMNVREFRGTSGEITMKPDGSSRGIYPSLYEMKRGKARQVFDD